VQGSVITARSVITREATRRPVSGKLRDSASLAARSASLLPRVRRDLRRQGRAGPLGEGIITWTAAHITLHGTAAQLPAGIDGEAVLLDLPIVCDIRPRALADARSRRSRRRSTR
jgi:hypothetical protein